MFHLRLSNSMVKPWCKEGLASYSYHALLLYATRAGVIVVGVVLLVRLGLFV